MGESCARDRISSFVPAQRCAGAGARVCCGVVDAEEPVYRKGKKPGITDLQGFGRNGYPVSETSLSNASQLLRRAFTSPTY